MQANWAPLLMAAHFSNTTKTALRFNNVEAARVKNRRRNWHGREGRLLKMMPFCLLKMRRSVLIWWSSIVLRHRQFFTTWAKKRKSSIETISIFHLLRVFNEVVITSAGPSADEGSIRRWKFICCNGLDVPGSFSLYCRSDVNFSLKAQGSHCCSHWSLLRSLKKYPLVQYYLKARRKPHEVLEKANDCVNMRKQ